MRSKQKVLLYIIGGEFLVLFILAKLGLKAQTLAASAIGVLLWLLPIEVLLLLVSKDPAKAPALRTVCKFLFWWLIICYVVIGLLKIFGA